MKNCAWMVWKWWVFFNFFWVWHILRGEGEFESWISSLEVSRNVI